MKSFKVSVFWRSYILKRGRNFWDIKFLKERTKEEFLEERQKAGKLERGRERERNDHKVKGGRRKRSEKKDSKFFIYLGLDFDAL